MQTHSQCLCCVSAGTIKDGVLTIGTVSAPVYNPSEKMKVPDVLFYDNPQVITQQRPNPSEQPFFVCFFKLSPLCGRPKREKRLFPGHDPHFILMKAKKPD